MSDTCYILIYNNETFGVFTDKKQMNLLIDGCIQKKFIIPTNLRIVKFKMNSIYSYSDETFNKSDKNVSITKLNQDNTTVPAIPSENMEEYKKMMEEKIIIKHKINELVQKKKQLKEYEQIYETDIDLYFNFKEKKEKDESFEIPELFALKYEIFRNLEENNELSFANFYNEWEKVKPKNNYNLFTSTPYENSFIENDDKKLDIELEI